MILRKMLILIKDMSFIFIVFYLFLVIHGFCNRVIYIRQLLVGVVVTLHPTVSV